MSSKQESAQRALQCLDETNFRDEHVSVMVETSEDEAMMIGTADAYIRLAVTLLRAVTGLHDGGSQQVADVELACMPSLADAFDTMGHVVPTCLYVAAEDSDRKRVADHFHSLGG